MTATLLDGILVSDVVKSSLKQQIESLSHNAIVPCLATILIGEDAPSIVYVNNKQKAAKSIGIRTLDYRLSYNTSEKEVIKLLQDLNNNKDVHGILIQLPLPDHLNTYQVLNHVDPNKDVDGLTTMNAGLIFNSRSNLIPCTPLGIIELLGYYNIPLKGMDAVVINRSSLVGKPLACLLLEKDVTVTICHSSTKHLETHIKNSELIITAVGNRDKFVLTSEVLNDNSIVIDVGTNRINGKLCGDVDFPSVKDKVRYITPVPGGVGPMTISMLLKNTVIAAKQYLSK